jgi:glycosyltransferase involved in cell wall biosynthesis
MTSWQNRSGKMRICYIFGGAHATDGGIGFLQNLCSNLRMLGHQCFAVLGGSNDHLMAGTVDREIHLQNDDWSLGCGASQRRSRNQLRAALMDLKPDVVHVIHPSGGNRHIHALPVIWRDFPVVVTFWAFNLGPGKSWKARAMAFLLLWGSKALASHDFKLMAQARQLCLGLRQVHFLPVGSNILPPPPILAASRPDLRQRHNLERDYHYLAYFGGFDPNMGVTDLFQALRRLREEGHDRLRLLLIGWQRHVQNPRFLAIRRAIEREEVEDLLVMTPFAPEEEVAELLRAADLVVLPFRHNSMGRTSLMAALSVGAPVVLATSWADQGPLNGAIASVPPNSPLILAQQIAQLLKDPHRATDLGLSGRQVWEHYFSWPVIAQQHLQLYKNL